MTCKHPSRSPGLRCFLDTIDDIMLIHVHACHNYDLNHTYIHSAFLIRNFQVSNTWFKFQGLAIGSTLSTVHNYTITSNETSQLNVPEVSSVLSALPRTLLLGWYLAWSLQLLTQRLLLPLKYRKGANQALHILHPKDLSCLMCMPTLIWSACSFLTSKIWCHDKKGLLKRSLKKAAL